MVPRDVKGDVILEEDFEELIIFCCVPEPCPIERNDGKVSEYNTCARIVLVILKNVCEPIELWVIIFDGYGDIEGDDEDISDDDGVVEWEVATWEEFCFRFSIFPCDGAVGAFFGVLWV